MKIAAQRLRSLIASQGYTHTRLAKDAGLSRQALHAILTKDRAEVRSATVQGLVRALKLPDENTLCEDPLAGYKAAVAAEYAQLAFRGLGLPATEPRLLEDLFVPVRVRQVPLPKRDESCGLAPSGDGGTPAESSVVAEEAAGGLTVAECLQRYPRLLLRGEPGSGKTTSLQHVARSYAEGAQSKYGYPSRALTPLFIRLADFAKAREPSGDLDLVRFVLARVQPVASPDSVAELERFLIEELRQGACLVLLDGLDEVGRDSSLAAALRDFVGRYPSNQFVLTSRVVGLDAGPWNRLDFETCDITRWQEDDIRDFAHRWYTSRHVKGGKRQRKEAERQAEELSAAILSHPPLREIATNPLMLTILAALHHANAALPRRRVDLYDKVVEVLLETWEAGKRDARPGDPLHGIVLERREFGWLLARLALAMQRDDRVLMPRWWVTEFVQQFLRDSLALPGEEAKDQGDRVIRHLCERSGLLVERGPDTFGFSHRTFQEYFAARGILDEAGGGKDAALSLLRPYLYHPRWEVVVRLVAAQLAPAQATALVRTILDDPDPAGRFLRRGLRLTLGCLADGTAIADRRVHEQIFSGGTAVGESRWLDSTGEIIDALCGLGATRHAADAGRMLEDIEAAARRVLGMDDFFSLYQRIHGPVDDRDGEDDIPGAERCLEFEGHTIRILSLGSKLWCEAPEKWYPAVFRILRSRASPVDVKWFFIIVALRLQAKENARVRAVLEQVLVRDRSPKVRAACATALREAAAHHRSTGNRLLRALAEDRSNYVRMDCAAALEEAAPLRADVRERLLALVGSSAPDVVRVGTVLGLKRVASSNPRIVGSLLARTRCSQESALVRAAILEVLSDSLAKEPTVQECLISGLDDSAEPIVQQISAESLAEALTDGRQPWSPELVAKVEAILMATPKPCPNAWQALRQLVAAKESRCGVLLERLIGAALTLFADRITLAFVFGSVARREQGRDSDIDLLIIGDVRLKELAASLHTAEQALGRVVNPALYTPATFREKYQAGDPFLLDVVRNEKIFLKGSGDELRELVAERLSR